MKINRVGYDQHPLRAITHAATIDKHGGIKVVKTSKVSSIAEVNMASRDILKSKQPKSREQLTLAGV